MKPRAAQPIYNDTTAKGKTEMKKSLWILALGLAVAGICATVEQYAPTPGVEFRRVLFR